MKRLKHVGLGDSGEREGSRGGKGEDFNIILHSEHVRERQASVTEA